MVVSPRLGLRPKSPQFAAGMRIEPPPSLACAAGTMPAATAAAAPPEEPPVECLEMPRIATSASQHRLCRQCKSPFWRIGFAEYGEA